MTYFRAVAEMVSSEPGQIFNRVLVTQICLTLCSPRYCSLCPWNSPDKNTRVGSHCLLQSVFLTQGLNWGLLIGGWILYHLSHQETNSVF